MFNKIAIVTCLSLLMINKVSAVTVPGSVPPVQMTTSELYADASRGIAVPEHKQLRMQKSNELLAQAAARTNDVTFSDANGQAISGDASKAEDEKLISELERIANDGGYLNSNNASSMQMLAQQSQEYIPAMPGGQTAQGAVSFPASAQTQVQPAMPQNNQMAFNQVNTGFRTVPTATGSFNAGTTSADAAGGVEIAVGRVENSKIDVKNSLVRLKEDRISIRRVVRRMLDQIGGGAWNIVWSLSEENANLPDMEISIYTQEPFMNVLNALLARLQTRSGQSLRVIKYDNAQKIVITDQQGAINKETKSAGVGADSKVAVTEQVLKEAKVVLHYDEIPLVDALENLVNQASDGQWRLRVYAGMDQVLKPAHIEEPFNIAMERILTLFNLKYEIFPGGKLVVVTSSGAAGFTNLQQ